MMDTTDRPIRTHMTTSTPAALAQRLAALRDHPMTMQVLELVALCRQMSQQYRAAPETYLEHSWWRLFNQAGIRLHEALDQAKAEGYQGLSHQEAEQAYFLLIHVAYFFEPGGVAEELWPLLPAESGEQGVRPPTSEALGVVFASSPRVPTGARVRQWVRRCFQRLGQLLSRGDPRDKERAELLARAAQRLAPLEEEAAPLHSLATRRFPDGTHPGR